MGNHLITWSSELDAPIAHGKIDITNRGPKDAESYTRVRSFAGAYSIVVLLVCRRLYAALLFYMFSANSVGVPALNTDEIRLHAEATNTRDIGPCPTSAGLAAD